ncbi:MAG TPA: UDP-N-acetylmuramate--L-alanine ligase [Acidimicrobiales bacterium]|nr:UDP-N-acetylmuramate--L-alanine ligase [Acidimicrobiales bacterium]
MNRRAGLDLGRPRVVHIVGIGGSGMNAIATVLRAMGHRVSGSDLKASAGLERLLALGVDARVGHGAENLPEATEAVVISTAVPATNPEVQEAGRRGIPVLRRADALAAICATRRTIAVAGTHGKTTTSSMLALVLVEAGLRPSFIIGGELNAIGSGAVWSDGEWFVVEADESDGTFLELGAEVAVVTSVEPDHLEHWGGFGPLRDAFGRFLESAGHLRVTCGDDPGAAELGEAHGAVSYGTAEGCGYRIVRVRGGRAGIRFAVEHGGAELGSVELPVPGLHNARNAAAALATALELGVPFAAAARGLGRYAGVARRYQFRGERDGVTFVDDYAHLPGEVASVLTAAREGGWQRIVCVFQPHRFSRTAALAGDFADAFDGADVLVVTEIDAAGEAPRPGVSGKLVLDAVLDRHPGRAACWFPSRAELAGNLRAVLRPGDLCLTLGAGDLTLLPTELLS